MKINHLLFSLSFLIFSTQAGLVFAQAKPEVLVKQRQAGMQMIGKYFGPLSGMPSGKAPYKADVVIRNAAFLEMLSKMPWDGFTEATKDTKSSTLPAVFTEMNKFEEKSRHFQSTVDKLAKISKSGDEAGIKAAIGEIGKSCADCHDSYRVKP